MTISSMIGQCYPDRHNTSPDTKWLSCTATQSPNPTRGVSHWLQLELEEYKALGNIYLWNIADPDHLNDGSSTLAIDISVDGEVWTEVTNLTLEIGQDDGIYEGEEVGNLNGVTAKYVLITSLTNHGGSCHGLSELKIETVDFPCADDELLIADDPIKPGVYAADIRLQSNGVVDSEVYLFGEDEVILLPGFMSNAGAILKVDNHPCN